MNNLDVIYNEILSLDKSFNDVSMIDKQLIYEFLENLKCIMFPNIYKSKISIRRLYIETKELFEEINVEENILNPFFNKLIDVKTVLLKDIEMFLKKDPACESKEEVVLSYNSFYAIFIYRISHLLYILNVPYIPRILTEYAHSKTGIDIHPACIIDEGFFIDHGTGIVIGETTIIGKNVSIYQGVTLGAKSLDNTYALKGKKRHPTINDNVTIYANAVILGGSTIIESNSIVPCNSLITK